MFSNITSAQVGSAVRWLITTAGSISAVEAVTAGLDWQAVAAATATLASLLWSFYSNTKKVG